MHDLQLKDLCGWPDLESSASIVRNIKQSLAVSKPGALPAGNWDCYIVQFSTLEAQTGQRTFTRGAANEGNNKGTINATTSNHGGLKVYAVPTGTALDLQTSVVVGTINVGASFLEGASRMISNGFEVINTTAPLNRQGQVTVYRQDQGKAQTQTFTTGTTAFSAVPLRRPPEDIGQAMLLPGSRTWEAEKGAYVVTGFLGQDNPPLFPTYATPAYNLDANDEDSIGTVNTTNVAINNVDNTGGIARVPPTKFHPIHQSGAIFTGLSEETTLTVFNNCYIESFPGPSQPDIVVLATPSAVYDPVALEILSQAMSRLPVGVPSEQNAFGDWFMSAVESVANFVTPVAMALGMPGVAAVSGAAGLAAGAVKNYLAAPSPQSQPRNVQYSRVKVKNKNKNKNKNKRIMNGTEKDVTVRR
jgi:hypothetical protein